VVLAFAWACGRTQAEADMRGEAATPSSGPTAAGTPSGPASSASARASTAASAGVPVQWHGSYKSTSGELYIPPDWKSVHWNVKESSAGIGEGAMTLSVDPAGGRVLGSLDGPLGPALIDGLASDGRLTATVARKDPSDRGFTGTLFGSISGEHAEGTMSLAQAEVDAVRKATFALSRNGQAAPH
jgi:hypothetical protein